MMELAGEQRLRRLLAMLRLETLQQAIEHFKIGVHCAQWGLIILVGEVERLVAAGVVGAEDDDQLGGLGGLGDSAPCPSVCRACLLDVEVGCNQR